MKNMFNFIDLSIYKIDNLVREYQLLSLGASRLTHNKLELSID